MRFTLLIAVAALGASALSISPNLDSSGVQGCINNGCQCKPGLQAQECGCSTRLIDRGTNGAWTDIYECGTSGNCCRYGYNQNAIIFAQRRWTIHDKAVVGMVESILLICKPTYIT